MAGTHSRPEKTDVKGGALVRQLIREIEGRGLSMDSVSVGAGFGPNMIGQWTRGSAKPTYFSLECVWNYLGYDVVVVARAAKS